MASPGELRSCMATSLGVPESTIVMHDRTLSENGLRSKGGRGRSAARVTPLDAANLLIAIVGSTMAKETLATVADYADLPAGDVERGTNGNAPRGWQLDGFPIANLQALPAEHTFREALTALVAAAMDGGLDRALAELAPRRIGEHFIPNTWSIEVRLFAPAAQAAIEIMSTDFREVHRYSSIPTDMDALLAWSRDADGGGDLGQVRSFTGRTVRAVGALLAGTPVNAERQSTVTVPGASAPGQNEDEA